MSKFSNQYAEVFYDTELDAISLIFKDVAPLEEFIHINQKVLDIFKTLQTNRFFVDTRKIGVVSPEGQKWVIENLFSGMVKHINHERLYHVQVVPRNEIFGKFAAENIKRRSQTMYQSEELIIEAFEDELLAKNWLAHQPKLKSVH
ncbi:hypothetical protein BKI52_34530 [marine bacterium AO1-C]|nr:hypothetical protein BKI52_34530 [marine bacterium AO1-C]